MNEMVKFHYGKKKGDFAVPVYLQNTRVNMHDMRVILDL